MQRRLTDKQFAGLLDDEVLPHIWQHACRLTRSLELGAELYAITSEKLWRYRHTFKYGGIDHLKCWAYTTLRHAWTDFKRRHSRKVRDETLMLAHARKEDLTEASIAHQRESPKAAIIKAALQEGPPEQAAALLMYAEGLAYQEIASVTNTNLGTIRSRIHRARTRCKKLLGGST